ncbi:MAG: MFS transporter [Candidatus Nanopelagicus sp.]
MSKAFNRLWSASLVSNLADGVLLAAAPLLAITLTDNTVLISLLGAMVMLPWLLFAIPIGTLVDRLDRRYILAGVNFLRSGIVGLLAFTIAADLVNIYLLILAAFIIGTCEVATDTTAASLIPQILEEKQFEKANSRLQISETVVQGFIGAPLSGFLYALAIYIPFFFNSVGYIVAAILAFSMPIHFLQDVRNEKKAAEKQLFVADMRFGISYLYNHKLLRRLVLTTSLIGVCYSMATATIVLFMVRELDLPEPLFGLALTIQGVGGLVGAVVAPHASKRFGRDRVMSFAIFMSSFLLLIQGFSPNIYLFVGLAAIGAFTISQWNILLMSTYQSVIPNEIYGRIHGTRRTLVWGMMPIGSVLGGVLATITLRTPLYVGGFISTAIAIYSLKFFLNLGNAPTVSKS